MVSTLHISREWCQCALSVGEISRLECVDLIRDDYCDYVIGSYLHRSGW